MTWLWVKKRRAPATIFLLASIFTTLLHPTTADDEAVATTTTAATTTTPKEGGPTEGGLTLNATEYKAFADLTNFVGGINNWDFTGAWAKHDLAKLEEGKRPVPLRPDADNQGVFICQTSDIPSTLEKDFPPLHNATFNLTYFAKASEGELVMTGEVVAAMDVSETLFNYSIPGDSAGHPEGSWGTDNFTLPTLAAQGNFKIRLVVEHSKKGEWAAAEIRVQGITGPPIITTPAPPTSNVTQVTTPKPELNQTETTPSQVNGTTEAPPNTTAIAPTTTEKSGGAAEELSRLESVAQAVWDAFYVFLALFCACLVALVALIVHGRCKDDEPPPAVATYNPRTASYRMDKVYDNPSYDNNAV